MPNRFGTTDKAVTSGNGNSGRRRRRRAAGGSSTTSSPLTSGLTHTTPGVTSLGQSASLSPSHVVTTQPQSTNPSRSEALATSVLGVSALATTLTAAALGTTSSAASTGAVASTLAGALGTANATNVTTEAAVTAVTSAMTAVTTPGSDPLGPVDIVRYFFGGVVAAGFFGGSCIGSAWLLASYCTGSSSDIGDSSENIELVRPGGEGQSLIGGGYESNGEGPSELFSTPPTTPGNSLYGTPPGTPSGSNSSLYGTPPGTPGPSEVVVTHPDGNCQRPSVRGALGSSNEGGGSNVGPGGKHKSKTKHRRQTR